MYQLCVHIVENSVFYCSCCELQYLHPSRFVLLLLLLTTVADINDLYVLIRIYTIFSCKRLLFSF